VKPLEIGGKIVEKDRGERVPGDLPERRIPRGGLRDRLSGELTDGDDDDPRRTQMERRSERRDLSHGAIHVVVGADAHRWKTRGIDADAITCSISRWQRSLRRRTRCHGESAGIAS
jgi:hypothetical protein